MGKQESYKNSINTLYLEKERINGLIKNISDKEIHKRLISFEPPFYTIRNILETMGNVLNKFIIQYFEEKSESLENFRFYFWPGFSTLKNNRVFIWGSKTGRQNQERYFTGVGWENENKDPFYDCPSTLAYDQVLNNNIFDFNTDGFFSGGTHYFRVNQSESNNYLPLRLNLKKYGKKGPIFKALHVTTDEQFEQDKSSQHTLHIKIPQVDIKKSGFIVKGYIDKFIKLHNHNVKQGKYLWKWPFNVLPYEEELKKRQNINSGIIFELCKGYQEKHIDIQTHLYSYWIAETLGNGHVFCDDTNKEEFKKELNKILRNRSLLKLEEKFGFFDKIDVEKEQIKTNSKFRNVYFNHWYTIYHEGVTVKEDLGSTMLLTSHKLPPDLLFYISSWIEDVYNNLKLVENMAMAEYSTYKMDFNTLYHTQLPYMELFKSCVENGNNPQDLISIIEYLRYGLKIARNYLNTPKLKEDLEYRISIDVLDVITESQNIINILCKNENILGSFFRINDAGKKDTFKSLAEHNKIITIENENSAIINTNKEAFEMIIHELLFNCVKHSIFDSPNIRIVFTNDGDKQVISFYNNTNDTEQAFYDALKKTKRQGVKIIKKLVEVLDIELAHDIKDNVVCSTIKFKKHESE
jgi:hypothetical protein